MNNTTDWFDVNQLSDRAYQIVENQRYGMSFVSGAEEAMLIDAAIGVGDLRELVTGMVDTPVFLLLTHWHWDHIGNAAQFDDVRINDSERAPDGSVRIDALSDEFVNRPAQKLEEFRTEGTPLPDSFDPASWTIDPVEKPTPVSPGDTFDLGDVTIELFNTPGHSPGHLVALDRDDQILHGGDVIHTDRGLYIHFEQGDVQAYRQTFADLIDLRDEDAFDTLVTSHNAVMTGDELEIFDRLHDGLEAIIRGDMEPEVIETNWGEAHQYMVGDSPVLTSTSV